MLVSFPIHSGIPVAMSFGFCLAMMPLLSLDSTKVFGEGHTLIRHIPYTELSCPEEYVNILNGGGDGEAGKEVDDDEEQNDVEKSFITATNDGNGDDEVEVRRTYGDVAIILVSQNNRLTLSVPGLLFHFACRRYRTNQHHYYRSNYDDDD